MRMNSIFAAVSIAVVLPAAALIPVPVAAQPTPPAAATPAEDAASDLPENAEDSPERREALEALTPIATKISEAENSRAVIELTSRSMIGAQVVASEKTIYQIASQAPNRYRIHLKSDRPLIQVSSDGKKTTVLLGEQAYFRTDAPESLQEAVFTLPVPLGPYPEPLLALTLAGVEPQISLTSEMQSLRVMSRDPYDGVDATQIEGVQVDGVRWVLWTATEKGKERPLRMKVDLTPVVAGAAAEAGLPEHFVYELDIKFTLWRTDGELEESIFAFKPPAEAIEYESFDEFAQEMDRQEQRHPLVGSPAPDFTAKQLDDSSVESAELRGKVVVLDFWATWCGPCLEAMPAVKEAVERFEDRGVVMFAVNIGQQREKVQAFLEEHGIEVPVLLDADSKIADAYQAEAIPQTVVIGKDGRVESVHVGYSTVDNLKRELIEQLRVLVDGGRLAPAG